MAFCTKLGRGSVGLNLFLDLLIYKCCDFAHRVCVAPPPLALYRFYIKVSDHKAHLTTFALISVVIPAERWQAWVSIIYFFFIFICIGWSLKDKVEDTPMRCRTGQRLPQNLSSSTNDATFFSRCTFYASLHL